MRSERGFMLASKQVSGSCGYTTEGLVCRVDNIPCALNFCGLSHISWHIISSLISIDIIHNISYFTTLFRFCQGFFCLNLKYIPISFNFSANLSVFLIILNFNSFLRMTLKSREYTSYNNDMEEYSSYLFISGLSVLPKR